MQTRRCNLYSQHIASGNIIVLLVTSVATATSVRAFHCLPERASYDDAGNRVSDIVRSCPVRIYHLLLRYSPDYLATRCKFVKNRLDEFIGHLCVGKTATGYIASCRRERHWKLFPSFFYLLSRWNEPRGRVCRRHEQANRYHKEFFDLTVRS